MSALTAGQKMALAPFLACLEGLKDNPDTDKIFTVAIWGENGRVRRYASLTVGDFRALEALAQPKGTPNG